jgi:hypothetical protein
MKRMLALLALAVFLVVSTVSAQPMLAAWDKLGVPDFSQYALGAWGDNWCAPTAAASSIWYFSQNGYPDLVPGTGTDNEKANTLISAVGAEMGTSPDTGTPDGCIRDGWQNYMDDCYPPGPGQGFTTRLVYAANIGGGQALWDFMKGELYRGQDVMPLVSWDTSGGHAITMVGWDSEGTNGSISINDPGNNDEHDWSGEYLDVSINGFIPSGIQLAWDGSSGVIDAMVVTCPVPEPSVAILFGSGLLFIFVYSRARRQ